MKLTLLLIMAAAIYLVGCNDSASDFDKGYDDWSSGKKTSWCVSKEYQAGYDQADEDDALYCDGYYAGYNKKRCEHPNDFDYMDGYKEGKSDR